MRSASREGRTTSSTFEVDGKPVRTPVIVGPSDDTHTEVIKKFVANANTNDWPDIRRDRKDPRG